MVQCARICFGLSGIYEPDEAIRISKDENNKLGSFSVPTKNEKNTGQSTSKFVKQWTKAIQTPSNLSTT